MLTYTITEHATGKKRVYRGFSRYKLGSKILIVATFDGEAELFSADEAHVDMISEINRLYRDDYEREPEAIEVHLNVTSSI